MCWCASVMFCGPIVAVNCGTELGFQDVQFAPAFQIFHWQSIVIYSSVVSEVWSCIHVSSRVSKWRRKSRKIHWNNCKLPLEKVLFPWSNVSHVGNHTVAAFSCSNIGAKCHVKCLLEIQRAPEISHISYHPSLASTI